MNRFLMIYVEGSGSPTVKYDSESHIAVDNCKTEAKRLARATGKKVYILRAIKSIEHSEFIETNLTGGHSLETDDLPF